MAHAFLALLSYNAAKARGDRQAAYIENCDQSGKRSNHAVYLDIKVLGHD